MRAVVTVESATAVSRLVYLERVQYRQLQAARAGHDNLSAHRVQDIREQSLAYR